MTTPVIIDIIAAAILVGFTAYGARRGLFRALAGLLIVVLALLGARFAAEKLAAPAARMAEPAIQRQIERRLDEALADLPVDLDGAVRMPEEYLPEELLGILGITGDRLDALADQARESVRETGVSVLSAVAESAAEAFFHGLFYILAFLILTVLLNLAAKVLDLAFRLPVLHGANALGGAAVGLLEGVLLLFLLALLLRKLGMDPQGSCLLQFAARIL